MTQGTVKNEQDSPQPILESVGDDENISFRIYEDSMDVSRIAAWEIADLIRERAAEGKSCVLGLATGSSPTNVYAELVRMHREEGLSLANVITFNLDEYFPMKPDCLQSYMRFMNEHLFDHVDIPRENIHLPDGTLSVEELPEYCSNYEKKIVEVGGIDIQLLGIGRTGHIGFNEPGSGTQSRTRLITLDGVTRIDAASDFFGIENVPRRAITMGVATILHARRIIMLGVWRRQIGHRRSYDRRRSQSSSSCYVFATASLHGVPARQRRFGSVDCCANPVARWRHQLDGHDGSAGRDRPVENS